MSDWVRVASLADLAADEPLGAMFGDEPIGLYLLEGDVYAIGDICPHQGDIRLSDGWIEGCTVECPMHQAPFDIRTGACLGPPASEDVAVYKVKVENGEVMVARR